MTDNEIIKALECCGKNPPICIECSYKGKCNRKDCYDYLKGDALSLINRQKEKIELLNLENLQMIASIKHLKAEAIKEFAERLRKWSYRTEFCTPVVDVEDIDELEKEMVGESNG